MARIATTTLTANNRMYLYQLLSRELGCGKQTFLPAVEEALASDRMAADDLGFESTRALLEALDEFIKLTVFKGGRIYATVIAQPTWDDALAAFAAAGSKGSAGGGPTNKPWKRKKADKTLKPVRPKRVKRPEPVPEAEAAPETAPSKQPQRAEDAEPVTRAAVAQKADSPAEAAPVPEATAPIASTPEPAISLTVVYDPYSGIDRETTIQSHPVVPAPETARKPITCPSKTSDAQCSQVARPESEEPSARTLNENVVQPVQPSERSTQSEDSQKPAQQTQTTQSPTSQMAQPPQVAQAASAQAAQPVQPVQAPAQPAPQAPSQEPARVASSTPPAEVLATYPADFSTDVYLASERIGDLCELLPYGTDVFALLAEDYDRARTLELISGSRARATFPLRIQHLDSTEPIRVTLKKRSGSGLQWELASIE